MADEYIQSMNPTLLTISVVSHGQAGLVDSLLHDIETYCRAISIELILTLNLPEELPFAGRAYPFPIRIIHNPMPRGFGENHNQAFAHASGQYFCVMNPDIRLKSDPFHVLLACLMDKSVGVAAPLVMGASGAIEDSARRFPSPLKILCKLFRGCKSNDYVAKDKIIYPDWVGGMLMVFSRSMFVQIGGFDQRYFLYYEDVDLCARLRLHGYEVAICPRAKVIHLAQRSSHRSFRYLRWHLNSMMRFFLSPVYRKLLYLKLTIKK